MMDTFCKLCISATQEYLKIYSEQGAHAQTLITKHFHFDMDQNEWKDAIICLPCWNILNEFDKLYEIVKENCRVSCKVKSLQNRNESKLKDDQDLVEQNVIKFINVEDSRIETIKIAKKDVLARVAIDNIEETDQNKISTEDNNEQKEPTTKKLNKNEETNSLNNNHQKDNNTDYSIQDKKTLVKTKSGSANKCTIKLKQFFASMDGLKKYCNMYCDICKVPINSFFKIKQHMRDNHTKRWYILCCKKKLFKACQMREHLKWHEDPNAFKCSLCGKTFGTSSILNDHLDYTHATSEMKIYKCTKCPKSYARNSFLSDHQVVHAEKTFECKECLKKFASKSRLSQHVSVVHKNEVYCMCEICAKPCSSRQQYELHVLTVHKKIYPKVECDICGKWVIHINVHKKKHIKNYQKCPDCDKEFSHITLLKAHVTRNHRDPTHECTICQKKFHRKKELNEHTALHTGTDLYTCAFCPRTFRANSNKYTHQKRMHPKEAEELRRMKNGNYPHLPTIAPSNTLLNS